MCNSFTIKAKSLKLQTYKRRLINLYITTFTKYDQFNLMSIRACCQAKHSQSPKSVKSISRSAKVKSLKKSGPQSHPLMNMQDLNRKLGIIHNLYLCNDVEEMKILLKSWPNAEISQRLSSCSLIQLKPEVYFIGDVCNNLIHGYGLVIYNSKRFYQGYFHNNLKHGPGFERLQFGIYSGNYINNRPEGKGLFIWNNNDMYEGDFMGGIKHGKGQWISSKISYIGAWKQNSPEGMGIILTDESKYQGEIIAGVKHGQGKQTFKNGDIYIGCFVNGKFEGEGSYSWQKSGAIYKGTFKNGLRHGKGVWSNSIGTKFEGNYQNNRKNGNGIIRWSTGNIYRGDFFDDMKHGVGQMNWNNGSWYRGLWKYGRQQGEGQIYETGHSPHRGVFKDNSMIYQDINSLSTKLKLDHAYKRSGPQQRFKTEMISEKTTPCRQKQKTQNLLHKLQTLNSRARASGVGDFSAAGKIISRSQNSKVSQRQKSCSNRICSVIKTYLNSPTCNHKSVTPTSCHHFNSMSIRYNNNTSRHGSIQSSRKI